MNKYFIFLVLGILMLANLNFVLAHGEETFAQAETIIMQKIPCDNLTEEQWEILGDYFMEQMHPGELHEIMDERMGGEGSESLRQVHINMGLAFYCGEHEAFSSSMMNVMMNRGMMGYGGMWTNYSRTNYGFMWLFWILIIIVLVLIIVWLAQKISRKNKR